MGKSVITYVRLAAEERRIIECIQRRLGHGHLSDTIRMLIHLGLSALSDTIKRPCLPDVPDSQ